MTFILQTIFLILFCILTLQSCKIRKPEKHYQQAKARQTPYDVIIVPGVPFTEETKTWSRVMELRMKWAKYIWEEGLTKNIIFSGGAVYTPYSECEIMKLYAIEMGIPAEHIYLDSTAEHSTENVYYSSCIAAQHNWNNIALVTDPYQTKMVKRFLRKMKRKKGVKVDIIPTVYSYLESSEELNYTIDYKKAISSNFIDIVNTQSKLYRLKGTLGLNLDWDYCP